MTQRILIVDDDADIRELLAIYLQAEGFHVSAAANGQEALPLVRDQQPALILLDILMPGLDGLQLCQEFRQITGAPILFLSGKNAEEDKINALALGDDYITKPFSPRELVARVNAHLRRDRRAADQSPPPRLRCAQLEMDLLTHSLWIEGQAVPLSFLEFQLLALLVQNPHRIYSPEQLFEIIWKAQGFDDTRTVMVHVSNLRKKIEPDPANPNYILTIRGVGYRLNPALAK